MQAAARSSAERTQRIFLAEESETVAAQVRAWCAPERERLQVEVFPSGRQLLRRAEVEKPDLVLASLTLPQIDGLTLLRLLHPAGVPTVILAPDTIEGARGAMDALLAGAADCLIKRPRHGEMRLLATARGLRQRMDAWREPCGPRDGSESGAWFRLAMDARGEIVAGLPTRQPFPAALSWLGLALCSTPSLGRLLHALAEAPDRPSGGMLIGTALPARFSRALAETAARLWNRAVLELQPGERIRAGQWRVIPARVVLRPLGPGEGGVEVAWEGGRVSGERRLFADRISALAGPSAHGARLYLFDEPDRRLRRPLRRLADAGGAVLLHGDRFPLRQWATESGERPETEAEERRPASPRARRKDVRRTAA